MSLCRLPQIQEWQCNVEDCTKEVSETALMRKEQVWLAFACHRVVCCELVHSQKNQWTNQWWEATLQGRFFRLLLCFNLGDAARQELAGAFSFAGQAEQKSDTRGKIPSVFPEDRWSLLLQQKPKERCWDLSKWNVGPGDVDLGSLDCTDRCCSSKADKK